jgi:hypothetical protein
MVAGGGVKDRHDKEADAKGGQGHVKHLPISGFQVRDSGRMCI